MASELDKKRAVIPYLLRNAVRDPSNAFGKFIKTMRDDLTQKVFAEQLGISPQYLCDLENGRRMPSIAVADALIAVCDLDGPSVHKTAAEAHGWKLQKRKDIPQ